MSDTAAPNPPLPMLHLTPGLVLQYVGPLADGTSVYFLGPIGVTADPKALRSASDQCLKEARAAERRADRGIGREL